MRIRHNALDPRSFTAHTTDGRYLGFARSIGDQLEVRAANGTTTVVDSHRQAVDQLYFGTHASHSHDPGRTRTHEPIHHRP